jgi:hypothetical protein
MFLEVLKYRGMRLPAWIHSGQARLRMIASPVRCSQDRLDTRRYESRSPISFFRCQAVTMEAMEIKQVPAAAMLIASASAGT